MVEICQRLESVCLGTGVGNALELSKNLHHFRAELVRMSNGKREAGYIG